MSCALVNALLLMTCIYVSSRVVKKNLCAKQRKIEHCNTHTSHQEQGVLRISFVIDQHFSLSVQKEKGKDTE